MGGPGGPDGPDAPPKYSALQNARYFLRYLKSVWPLSAAVVILSLLMTLANLPMAFLPRFAENYARQAEVSPSARDSAQSAFLWYLVVAVAIGFLSYGMSPLRSYCGNRLGEMLLRAVRVDLFGRLERLSMLSVAAKGAGQFVQRLARDVFMVRQLVNETLTGLVIMLIAGSVNLALLLYLEWKLTLILLAIFAVVTPLVHMLNRRLERHAHRQIQMNEEIMSQLIEAVGGFRDILASGRFDKFARRFSDKARELEVVGVRTAMTNEWAGLVGGVMRGMLLVVPYFLVVYDLNTTTLITMMVYLGFFSQVLSVPQALLHISSQLALANPSLQAVRDVLESTPEAGKKLPVPVSPERRPERKLEPTRAVAAGGDAETPAREVRAVRKFEGPIRSIRFEHVTLVLGNRPLIQDVSFDIPGGKFTAVLGQSGAGKTTIFHLLLRLLAPTEGTIYFNDVPLAEIDEAQVRKLLGFIPQNPFMFNLSLRENLLMATAEQPSEGQLQRAIEQSQLSELVNSRRHEGGLEAMAGFMGARLSGGEKQRIALGRLLLQDPAVVVCDEYTANIDVRTARLIHEAIRQNFGDRTRIVITHELYTVRGADHLIVLDRGRVVQNGSHEQLVQQPGLYKAMWEVQKLQ